MCLFHKWSKWEQYTWEGTVYHGIIAPKEMRGKPFQVSEKRQRRKCEKCGYEQDREVTP